MYTAKQQLSASEIEYAAAGFPPGTDNVAEALDFLVGASPTVDPMLPAVRGTAFGIQDAPADLRNMNALGHLVNLSPGMSNCIDLYTASPFGQVQEMIIGNSLCIDNRNIQNTATTVSNASCILNENVATSAILSVSTVHANQSDLNEAQTENCVLDINDVNCSRLFAQQSVIVGCNSTLQNSTTDRSVIVAERASIIGINVENSTIIGSLDEMDISSGRENLILASKTNGGGVVRILGRQCAYIGNQARAETVNDREFHVSSYDRFFLDTPRTDIGPLICYFDNTTDELTVGAPQPAPVPVVTSFLATMLPVVWNTSTSTTLAVDNVALSRVFRAVGNTDAAGQVTFTSPLGINPTLPNVSFSAIVRNVSTTTAHFCTIQQVLATTIRVQVWRSTNAVIGGPTIIPAVSGTQVNFAMFY